MSSLYVSYTPPMMQDENKTNLTEELRNDVSTAIENILNKDIRDGFVEIK